jgi:hypothetical protein
MEAFAYDCILILQNMKGKQPALGMSARDSNGFKANSTANSGGFPKISSMKTHVTFKDEGDNGEMKPPSQKIDLNKQMADRAVHLSESVFQLHSEEMAR